MPTPLTSTGRQRRWGTAALVLTAITALVVGFVHVVRPGDATVTFAATDATAITAGEQVRIAGVSVGTVSSVEARARDALITLKVDRAVHIGDQSRVSVRMLTAVGGYYVDITPVGSRSLQSTIPADRVDLPYTLGSTIESVGTLGGELDATLVSKSLKVAVDGLRSNPDSLGAVADAANSIVRVLNAQSTKVGGMMDVLGEYGKTVADNRDLLWSVLSKAAVTAKTMSDTRDGWSTTILRARTLLDSLDPASTLYLNHRDDLRAIIDKLGPIAAEIAKATTPGIDGLTKLITDLTEVGRQLGSPSGPVLATDLCVPVSGRQC